MVLALAIIGGIYFIVILLLVIGFLSSLPGPNEYDVSMYCNNCNSWSDLRLPKGITYSEYKAGHKEECYHCPMCGSDARRKFMSCGSE